MSKLHVIAVGQQYTLFEKPDNISDGAVFETLYGGGYAITIYLKNMTMEEKELLLINNDVKVYFIKENMYLLPIITYENKMIFTLVFDPTKYIDKRKDTMFDSNMVTIVGVESTTNTVKTLRYANMPRRLFLAIMENAVNSDMIEDYSNKYNNWINDLYKRYNDKELLEIATYVGKMGEEKIGE